MRIESPINLYQYEVFNSLCALIIEKTVRMLQVMIRGAIHKRRHAAGDEGVREVTKDT